MKISALFVLTAGYGQRMGKIGEVLPKPLWPIFEKTLLELQFDFYSWIDTGKKVINVHHQVERIQKFMTKQNPEVQCLYESQLLEIGGAILNLRAEDPKLESVLISNVDQFLCLDPEKIKREVDELPHFDAILFALPVHRSQGYHQIEVSKNGRFLGVNQNPQIDRYLTYSGVALVNFSSITDGVKRVGFFQSIADPKKKNIKVVDGECSYYDFGTLGLYVEQISSIFNLMKHKKDESLLKFLKIPKVFDWKK